ncbi:MAG: TetR/AcrR family transcriptional regulator [Hyphomonadaceae bacterium]|nr:TetR/AcrR family transcriptional regulator [Hyphomonadaceae bacterium]GIK49348.1 MAG: TetR family transcriptional regulator [Alphaproteobacteria bacterium]
MKPAPENLRRTILDASLDLIAAEGLEGFSMREVARRAGVSHQAPYHHFPDREAIMAAIVAEGFQRLRDDSIAAIEGESDPYARMQAMGRAYIRFALHNPAHFKLMFRSEHVREDRHDDARAGAQSAYDVLLQLAGHVAAKSGQRTELVVLTAWSMVHGLATLMLEGKLDKVLDDSAERLAAADAAIDLYANLLRRA